MASSSFLYRFTITTGPNASWQEMRVDSGASAKIVGWTVARLRTPPQTSRAPLFLASSIHDSTRAASASVINEEMSVDSSKGCPTRNFAVAAANFARNSSASDSWA